MEKRISCGKVKKILPLYFDRNITPELQEQIEAHIASCPKCAKEKARWEKTVGLLRSTKPIPLPEGTGKRLHDRLVEYTSREKTSEQVKGPSGFRLPVPFLSGAAMTAILIIAGTLFYQKLWRGDKFPITTLSEQVLNINQDAILEFNVKVRQEIKTANIEITLPDSVKLVNNGKLASDLNGTINWQEELIEGENIFSVCVRGIKQGNWLIKLRIKGHDLARNIIMPVKITKI
jgi:hypothetical protein